MTSQSVVWIGFTIMVVALFLIDFLSDDDDDYTVL